MYTEDYENRGFPFRDFLLKLILIIIFVFLLVWLLPKFIKPATIENKKTQTEITAISSQIFNDNLIKMKEAAISYYTDERLPKEVGEYKEMTLREMISHKIITPLVDKNNKAVNVDKSYVKITKADDEYILKVNIKDSEKEDYILVHLGCYTYCDSYVCEKKTNESTAIKGAKPSTPQPSNPGNDDNKDDGNKDDNDDKPATETKYIYEYSKTNLSPWTEWGKWEKTSCSTSEVNCSDSDPKCLAKVQRYNQKQEIGTFKQMHTVYKQVSSYSTTTCSNYNYIISNNKTYTISTTYNQVSKISASTKANVGDWKYMGRKAYANPPRDTATEHYVFVGADYNYCTENCQSLADFYYDKYVYTGAMNQVSNTTSTPNGSSSSVTATCASYITTTIPVYGYETIEHSSDLLYGTICYKSTKTRTANTQTKWSSYNDTSLLNNGWSYTGNKKVAN